MKIDNYINNRVAVAWMLLLSLFLLPACSKEDDGPEVEPEQLARLIITLGSMDSAIPVTRAVDTEEEFEYERKIEKCWFILFDVDGKWVMTVSTDGFKIDNTDDDSRSETTIEVPAGNYTGYAFANLHNLVKGTDFINALEAGKRTDGSTDLTIDYLNGLAVSLGDDASAFKVADGKAIPMSSYAEKIVVQKDQDNKAKIGMFRMLGKVTITVTNKLGKNADLALNQLSMGAFRTGDILFLPYSEGDFNLNNIVETPAESQLQPSFPQSGNEPGSYSQTIVSDDNPVSITYGESKSFSFYAFETGMSTNQKNSGDISVDIKVNDRLPSTKKTDFSFIRRNDWLQIPILVTDIETRLWFENMRMPIGGLPYQIKYGDKDGIQILVDAVNEVDPDYAGPVKVSFELNNISGMDGPINLIFPIGEEVMSPWSEAKLISNPNGLLIDPDTGTSISVSEDNIPGIKLQQGEPDQDGNITSGSFEVWTQELSMDSDATIRLILVAEYGEQANRTRLEIPYTIRIQNYD